MYCVAEMANTGLSCFINTSLYPKMQYFQQGEKMLANK